MRGSRGTVLLFVLVACATVALTLGAIQAPLIVAALAFAAIAVGLFVAIKGWWRRAYVLTLLTMTAGASGIEAIGAIGSYAKMVAVIFLLAVTVITLPREKAAYANDHLHKLLMTALWLAVGFALVSVVWSESRMDTLFEGATTAALVFIVHRAGTVRWRDRSLMVEDLATAYWTMAAVIASGTVLAFAGVEGTVLSNARHQGLLSNPNLLGAIAAIVLCLGLGLAAHKRSPILWASLLVPAAAVVLSGSRTAMLAAAVGIALALLRGNMARIVPIGLIAAVGILVVQAAGINLMGGSLERLTEVDGGDLLNGRSDVWAEVLRNVQQNPLGVGWAATPAAMEARFDAGVVHSGLFTMHNSWIQMFNDLGWFGLIPILVLLVALMLVVIRANPTGLGMGLVAAVLAGFLIHFTESVMFGIGQPYPWLFWAVAVAAAANTDPKPKRERGPKRAKFYTLEPGTSKVRAIR